MSLLLALSKYLNRRLKQRRAQKAGISYEDENEISLRLLYEKTLPDGTPLADATPEEFDFARRDGLGGGIDWRNGQKYFTLEYWTLRKIVSFLITTSIITLVILALVFQDNIVGWLEPAGEKFKSIPEGWLIPIAIIIVQSFPPIIGQSITQIVVGSVFGIGPGFGIVAAGTLLGEVAEFFIFRILCGNRTHRFEKKSLAWGLLAHITRDGGFTVVLMCRLSILPSSYTTLLFALVGTNFFKYLAALVLSLVLPLANVFLGVLAREVTEGQDTDRINIASGLIIAGSVLISVAAMLYINRKANKAKPAFLAQRRSERFVLNAGSSSRSLSPSDSAFDATDVAATDLHNTPKEPADGSSSKTPYYASTSISHSESQGYPPISAHV